MRLVKYLAHAGVASRRKAEELIAAGRVTVAGEVVRDPARDVDDSDCVALDGKPVAAEGKEYYILNKPKGVISTASDPQGRNKVTDLVHSRGRVYPVGRLDIDTKGLILLTNDGELANRLMHPRYEFPKTYEALVQGAVGSSALCRLRRGIELEDGRTAPAEVKLVATEGGQASILFITIHEGRKRQLRRMCAAVGHPVQDLTRIQFGPIGLKGLKKGQSRPLTAEEVALLKQHGEVGE